MQYNAVFLMRMMANTRGMHTALFATQRKLIGLQSTTNQLNNNFKQLATTVGFFGGVAIAGATRYYINFNKELTYSFALLRRFGDTDTFGKMEDAAVRAAKATTFSAAEVGASYRFMFSAGMSSEQSIAAVESMAKFAQAGMFDLSRAVDLSTDALTALDWASKDPQTNLRNLTEIMDSLVHANTIANATVQQFSEALTKEAAAAARAYKIPLDEVIATLGVYADQGLKGALGGRMFSRFLRMVTASAVRNEEVFHRLGITIFDANGNMRSMVDIIRDLTSALNQFAPEQRSKVLEMLGFMARTQQTVLPLLDMTDELQDKLNRMRNKGGAVDAVVGVQDTSVFNQINKQLKGMHESFMSMGEKSVPLMSGAISVLVTLMDKLGSAAESISNLGSKTGMGLRTGSASIVSSSQHIFRFVSNLIGLPQYGEVGMTAYDTLMNQLTREWVNQQRKAHEERRRVALEAHQKRMSTAMDYVPGVGTVPYMTGGYSKQIMDLASGRVTKAGEGENIRKKVMRELQFTLTEAGKELADSVRNAAIDQAMRNNNPIRAMSLMAQEYMRLQQASVGLEFDDLVANMRKRFDLSMQLRGLLQDYSGGSVLAPALMPGTREFQEARYSRNGGAQSEMSALTEVLRLNKDATTQLKDTLGQMLIDWTRGGQIQPGAIPQAGF